MESPLIKGAVIIAAGFLVYLMVMDSQETAMARSEAEAEFQMQMKGPSDVLEAITKNNYGKHIITVSDGTKENIAKLNIDMKSRDVILTHQDANKLGLKASALPHKYKLKDEDGQSIPAASVVMPIFKINSIVLRDVRVFIGEQGAFIKSAVGMAALGKLKRVSRNGNKLLLRSH